MTKDRFSQFLNSCEKVERTSSHLKQISYRFYHEESSKYNLIRESKEVFNLIIRQYEKKTNTKAESNNRNDYAKIKSSYPRRIGPHYNVLFSGGADSLALVLRHLEKKEKVALHTILFNETDCFIINKIIDLLKAFYGGLVNGPYQLFDTITVHNGESLTGYNQQPICAFYSAFIGDELKIDAIATEIAYCMNDDAISYLSELNNIYENTMSLKVCEFDYPKLSFPLTKTKHIENVSFIKDIENKFNIMFPYICGEYTSIRSVDVGPYTIEYVETENKDTENKKGAPDGYILISIHYDSKKKIRDSLLKKVEKFKDEGIVACAKEDNNN